MWTEYHFVALRTLADVATSHVARADVTGLAIARKADLLARALEIHDAG